MRHKILRQPNSPLDVSIHAPVKDATLLLNLLWVVKKVSIHAPVKDATYYYQNLTAYMLVSIHAPVKDATLPMPENN